MLEKFDFYWNVIHGVMVVATILDPRYKIELLEYYFPLIYGDEVKNEIQKVRDTCMKWFVTILLGEWVGKVIMALV